MSYFWIWSENLQCHIAYWGNAILIVCIITHNSQIIYIQNQYLIILEMKFSCTSRQVYIYWKMTWIPQCPFNPCFNHAILDHNCQTISVSYKIGLARLCLNSSKAKVSTPQQMQHFYYHDICNCRNEIGLHVQWILLMACLFW